MNLNFLKKTPGIPLGGKIYSLSLGNKVTSNLIAEITDQWTGNSESGAWLCNGTFSHCDDHLEWNSKNWEPEDAGDYWLSYIHEFSWLRDLKAVENDHARRQARHMVNSWMSHYHDWHPTIWKTPITGERLSHWITHYNYICEGTDSDFQTRFLACLIRQARHLARAFPGSAEGFPRLQTIKGLVMAGLVCDAHEHWLHQALDQLKIETEKQILSDGGHISRSPETLKKSLQLYLDIRHAMQSCHYPVSDFVQHGIDRMAQALRFFIYPDKKRALFNGSQEGTEELMETMLMATGQRGRVLRSLPHTGYERLSMGRSLLMVDTAPPPGNSYNDDSHAAPLAFEFSYGKQRVFVSCGSHPLDQTWKDVLRGTAAHSALILDDRNACEIATDGHILRKPQKVTVTREDIGNASLLDTMHDGYVPINGVIHKRRFYLGDKGHDFRGEDMLVCKGGLVKPADVAIRFHLHPRVLVSLIQDGREALLRLPGGIGWRFFHDEGQLALENSIYLGFGNRPVKTKQIVIYGHMDDQQKLFKWAVRRESR